MQVAHWLQRWQWAVLAWCLACTTVSAQAQEDKPFSLLYAPQGAQSELKYPLKLGVLDVRDRRVLPFYSLSDGAIAEPVPRVVGDILYSEMRASGLFGEVLRLREAAPDSIDQPALLALKRRYGVDLLLVADLHSLNLHREKQGHYLSPEYTVVVQAGWVAQLIYPDEGVVVWGDGLDGKAAELAPTGTLPAHRIAAMARQAIATGMADMRALIARFGKRMQ